MHSKKSKNLTGKNIKRWQQHGVILPLFAIGMLMILIMGGLALDMSHAMLNKARLQNTVDAAALNAAKTLDEGGDTGMADGAARTIIDNNAAAGGNGEMAGGLGAVTVEFSATVDPFAPGTAPAEYVRVRVEQFSMAAWLVQLIGMDTKTVRASAVSGPTPTIGELCKMAPLIVCGDPDAGGPYWGYSDNDITVLKGGSKSGSSSGPIGPGNFQLARMPGDSGASDLRDSLAGGYEGCTEDGMIPTEPGNTVGPTAQGLNTRLNKFTGPISPGDYPPDAIVTQQDTDMDYDADTGEITLENGSRVVHDISDLDFAYSNYQSSLATETHIAGGIPGRRNLSVVIADCEGKNTGQTELPILGVGCYFLLQEIAQKGNEAEVFGQFVTSCEADGNVGPVPTEEPGPHKIVLYKDTDSIDS